ncbi:MAG: methyltransferase MtaB domain-containing protein [Nitrososphaerota archaeon]|nr:methanol--corrinoid methyltransferase [Aigarchaeota archaeon]MDW8077200.1 methyltransferase MtaB domain-containing protein [Nitrososphaerota archaeon]
MPFKELAYKDADELIFGFAKKPLSYGLGLSVGDGKVVPEVKYLLKPGFEQDLNALVEEYKKVTLSIMERAVNLGVKDVQLETEFVEPMTINPGWGAAVIEAQKEILLTYHEKYGIRSALRATIADVRRFDKGLRKGEYFQAIMDSFSAAAEGGADLMSIESRGGQEVFSYSLIRNDLAGTLFSLGILAPRDVRYIWREIVKNTGKAIPAGDTACAIANSAMVLANGLVNRKIPHTLAAVIRAMSAVRTLACYEEGARGPGKDCAYENVIIKIITGYPMSMEGKTSAFAHSSLVGNIVAAACDLWSNETITVDDTFGGKTPAIIFEMLSYDTALMNESINSKNSKTLQQLFINSDKYRDPQALILSPDNAFRIAKSIVSVGSDYERTVSAAIETIRIIEENLDKLRLPEVEKKYLITLKNFFDAVPEEDKLIRESIRKYSGKVSEFNPSNYEL